MTVKNVVIGERSPKIIGPTTDNNADDILHFVEDIAGRNDVHIIELRLDTMNNDEDAEAMTALSRDISSRLQDKLLLVTFRTKAEGGKKEIDDADYFRLLSEMVRTGKPALLTISMGGEGALSRMSGELTGSALTFAMVGDASAPGQLAADKLNGTFELLHQQLG